MGVRIYCSLHDFVRILKGKEKFEEFKRRGVLVYGSHKGHVYEMIGEGRVNEKGKVEIPLKVLKNSTEYAKFMLQIKDEKEKEGGKR